MHGCVCVREERACWRRTDRPNHRSFLITVRYGEGGVGGGLVSCQLRTSEPPNLFSRIYERLGVAIFGIFSIPCLVKVEKWVRRFIGSEAAGSRPSYPNSPSFDNRPCESMRATPGAMPALRARARAAMWVLSRPAVWLLARAARAAEISSARPPRVV